MNISCTCEKHGLVLRLFEGLARKGHHVLWLAWAFIQSQFINPVKLCWITAINKYLELAAFQSFCKKIGFSCGILWGGQTTLTLLDQVKGMAPCVTEGGNICPVAQASSTPSRLSRRSQWQPNSHRRRENVRQIQLLADGNTDCFSWDFYNFTCSVW